MTNLISKTVDVSALWPIASPCECLNPNEVDYSRLTSDQRRSLEAMGWTEKRYSAHVAGDKNPAPFSVTPLPYIACFQANSEAPKGEPAKGADKWPVAYAAFEFAQRMGAEAVAKFEKGKHRIAEAPFVSPQGDAVDFEFWCEAFAEFWHEIEEKNSDMHWLARYPEYDYDDRLTPARRKKYLKEWRLIEELCAYGQFAEDALVFMSESGDFEEFKKTIKGLRKFWERFLDSAKHFRFQWECWTAAVRDGVKDVIQEAAAERGWEYPPNELRLATPESFIFPHEATRGEVMDCVWWNRRFVDHLSDVRGEADAVYKDAKFPQFSKRAFTKAARAEAFEKWEELELLDAFVCSRAALITIDSKTNRVNDLFESCPIARKYWLQFLSDDQYAAPYWDSWKALVEAGNLPATEVK